MSRLRNDVVTVRPSNNIYTALLGVSCLVAFLAIVFVYLRWQEITDGAPLFFGLF